jgi:hypothetical protein
MVNFDGLCLSLMSLKKVILIDNSQLMVDKVTHLDTVRKLKLLIDHKSCIYYNLYHIYAFGFDNLEYKQELIPNTFIK